MTLPDGEWIRVLLTVAFGALAGGLTNRVAIWMLFHPYEPPRMAGRRLEWLQGAVPKNQARLARTIGNAVGTRLLTPADISAELRDEALRSAFQDRLRELAVELVREEGPTLAELLPPAALEEVRELLASLFGELRGELVASAERGALGERAEHLLEELAASLRDEPVGESLSRERVAGLRRRADEGLERLVESEALERTVRRHLGQAAGHVLRPGRTLEALIPGGLVSAVEHAIQDYLPLAMERLGRLLEDPDARARVEEAVHGLLDRFMRDLKFHQRVVAKLIITEETVDRVLETLRAEGADQLAELLREDEVQAVMARNVNEAIVEFLRRPTTRVFGEADDPQVLRATDAVGDWLLRAVRDPGARRFLLEQLEDAVWKAGERTWGEVVALLPAHRAGGWLAAALESEAGRALYDSLADSLTEGLLHRPVGTVTRFLREDAAVRLADAAADPAWEWVTGQIPEVAARVRVADRVEEKIRDYPLEDLEALVRSVTEHELDLIVRLGYVLGAVIGTILVGVNALVP